jgi:hypothetical protein
MANPTYYTCADCGAPCEVTETDGPNRTCNCSGAIHANMTAHARSVASMAAEEVPDLDAESPGA